MLRGWVVTVKVLPMRYTSGQITRGAAQQPHIWQVVSATGYTRKEYTAIRNAASEKSWFCFYSVPFA